MRHIPSSDFIKGLWRNGRGVSWDIASDRPFSQNADFGWRFAIAEIAASGPFSVYGPVDRVFTLLEGDGLTLTFANGRKLQAHRPHVPLAFPCDIATDCALKGGPCRALNLFTARGTWNANVRVVTLERVPLPVPDASLIFALQGDVVIETQTRRLTLSQGDAAELAGREQASLSGDGAKAYVASLTKEA
jgi:environmental stress-induced protein Ves